MNRITTLSLCLTNSLLAGALCAQQPAPATNWALDSSTLTYHMSHPVHEVDGTSHVAKGKGVCKDGQCDFLLAVPVKSFDSGDTNRDLHMLQVTRGAQFPYVTVRLHLPESALASPSLICDIEVQFAGQTAHYSHSAFPAVHGRGQPSHYGVCSGHSHGLQDRSPNVSLSTNQERHPRESRHEVAPREVKG